MFEITRVLIKGWKVTLFRVALQIDFCIIQLFGYTSVKDSTMVWSITYFECSIWRNLHSTGIPIHEQILAFRIEQHISENSNQRETIRHIWEEENKLVCGMLDESFLQSLYIKGHISLSICWTAGYCMRFPLYTFSYLVIWLRWGQRICQRGSRGGAKG